MREHERDRKFCNRRTDGGLVGLRGEARRGGRTNKGRSARRPLRPLSFCSRYTASVLTPPSARLVNLRPPHRLATAPIVVEDRPQRLIEILPVAEERLAQHALLHRADLPQ